MKTQLIIFTILLITSLSTSAKDSQKPCTDLEKFLAGGCIGVDRIGPTREEQLKYEKLLEQRHKAQKLKKIALENKRKRAQKEKEEKAKREAARKKQDAADEEREQAMLLKNQRKHIDLYGRTGQKP